METVTIKDVAADAGVSVGTVSRVLNHAAVKEVNRIKVEESIRRMDYHPNVIARGMRSSQTYTVAFILPDLVNPFFGLLVNYTEQVLASFGYRMLLCNSRNMTDRELEYLTMARQNKVDGILAITFSGMDEYFNGEIPLVSIDRYFGKNSCCVTSDNAMGGRLAAEHFAATGCRKVLYFWNGTKVPNAETTKRGEAFLETCRQKGIESKETYLGGETAVDEDVVVGIRRYIEKTFSDGIPYDGVFCSSDYHAMYLREALTGMGIDVPGQVQIIGYDGLRVMNSGPYVVSSIRQPIKAMAIEAVNALFRLINGEACEPFINLPVELVDGGTTRSTLSQQNVASIEDDADK